MPAPAGLVTFLFTDIEGSSRLWETDPERMRPALARHDALIRGTVERHRGAVVKMLGDGVHAAFDDPADAIAAIVELQVAMAEPPPGGGLALRVRSGLNCGAVERRDGDFFGSAVNRAARIMSVAHGGQILLSQSVVALVVDRMPQGVTLRDLGLVRLRDLASPEHVFQILHPKLRHEFPALRSLEATPNNLPQQVTTLVGRERELAEVKRLLTTTRLLTLIGAGGIGKTRIALHTAAEVMDDYANGVWFVDLAPLSDPRLVPQTVASALGVAEEAGASVTESLVRFAKDKRLLLVLDNCEHLLHACADLASHVLRAGAQLRILAASREPLRVAGETTYPVPALAVPDARTRVTPEVLQHYEASRLFVERATAANSHFRANDANAASIADVCRRLDGIPLAIELAAARVRALPVEAIDARLSDRFRLLSGGDQTALPRQQTLRALIDWSHDLLTEPEKILLRRLSVFAGGWTLEAAEAVGAGGMLIEADVLELLTHLVDKSLVAMDADGSRYRLLETVREYAHEKLEASGEGPIARSRHLEYFVRFAEEMRPVLNGPGQPQALARFDAERENLVDAYAWAAKVPGGGEMGLRLAYATGSYLFIRGQPGMALRISLDALARPDAQAPTRARSRTLFDVGQQFCFTGRYAEAEPLYDRAVSLAREIGDRESVAIGLLNLTMVSIGRGTGDRATDMLREVIAIAAETGSKQVGQCALDVSAGYGAWREDWERAAMFFGAAQAQVDETGLQRDPADEAFLLPLIHRAREVLGEHAFERAVRAGRQLSYEQGIDEARAWLMRAS